MVDTLILQVHPLLKFMELEQQTEQGGSGLRRTMMGADLTGRTDVHHEGQVGLWFCARFGPRVLAQSTPWGWRQMQLYTALYLTLQLA